MATSASGRRVHWLISGKCRKRHRDAEVHIQAQGNDGVTLLFSFNGSHTGQRKCAILSSNVSPASWCKQDLHFCHNTDSNYDDVTIADSKMVITNVGNVGIGTASPSSRLHVNLGNASGEQHIRATQTSLASSTAGIRFGDSTWDAFIDHSHGSKDLMNFGFYRNPTRQVNMVLSHEGNVGIGTTSPVSKLNVSLDSQTNYSNTVGLTIENISSDYTQIAGGFGSRIQFKTNRGTSPTSTLASADIKGYIYSGAGGTADYHALDLDVYGDNSSLNRGISILSQSSSGGPANTIMYGNVGIGTVSPSGALHVNGENIYLSSKLVSNCTWRIMPQTGNSTKLFRIYDQDNASDRLVIDASGDVGIGTTSPGYKLHVNGSSMFTSTINLTTSSGYAALEMGGPSGAYIDLKKPASDDYDLRLFTSGTGGSIQVGGVGDVMNFNGSGNVGIGTTSPGAKLDVNGYIAHNNPVFYAHNFGNGGGGTTSSNYIVYRNTEVNVGSNFSTSTGIFTCPRNGVYKFTWGAIANNSDTVYRYYIRINNANIINGTHNRIDNTANGSNFGNGTSSIILTLSTNDTVRIFYIADNGSTSSYGYNYDIFMGYMISA